MAPGRRREEEERGEEGRKGGRRGEGRGTDREKVKKAVVDVLAGDRLQLQNEAEVDAVKGGVDAAGGEHDIVGSVDGAERVLARKDGREGDDFVQDLEVCVVGSTWWEGTNC